MLLTVTGSRLSVQTKDLATKGLEQTVAISRQLETASSEFQAKLDDIPRLVQEIQDSLASMRNVRVGIESERTELEAQLGEVSRLGRVIEEHATATRSVAVQMNADKAEARAIARQTSTDLLSLTEELRNVGPSVCGIFSQVRRSADSHVL